MHNTTFYKIAISIFFLNLFGCSTISNIIYQPNIIQGNYLDINDLKKINTGMNKELIFSILGTPILQDPFGSNTCYYIFYEKLHHRKILQKTLTLTFNNKNILISMNH